MKNIGVYIISGVLTFLSLSSCSTDKTEEKHKKQVVKEDYTPEFNDVDASFIKETKKDIYPFYNEVLGNKRFNGMFLVAKNGKIIFEKVNGYLNYEEEEKLNATTPIHLASISKVATALATMRLVDQQKIKLEDDIRKYLPTIPYKGITVRMLLNHRSGIPYYGYFSEGIWNKKYIMRNKDVIKMIHKHKFPLNYPAGTHFAYCNTNYALLAMIVEKASNKKFPKAMKELIFEPLGMKNSFIMDKPEKINTISPSYNSRYTMQAVDFLDGVYGDKNMYSTARDLLKMDIATYSKDFLSENARKEIYKGYSYERKGTRNYGLGMRMVEVPNKKPYFFHTGWWHGNTGCYATLRGDTVCIVAISNAYTKSVYRIHQLSQLFEGYPFEKENDE